MPSPGPTPRPPWRGRRIVLGVTGGIAAYKSVQLARDLTRLGAEVEVVLTRGAREFVAPLSFEGVTGRPAHTGLFGVSDAALHVRLAREADVVCVAPATADLLARAAHGRADDLLCAVLLATPAPVLLCPAMNDRMWAHPQVRANVAHLEGSLGYGIAGPATGPLAVGEGEGPGRMLEPQEIVEHLGRRLAAGGPLDGRKVVVTAGPTHEPLDPVRYVGNRSSGRMGYALARAAWRRGADVTLVSGPTELPDPTGVEVVRTETAVEMLEAVRAALPDAGVAIFAAAVSDYRPDEARGEKIKRRRTGERMEVALTSNPDIVTESRERIEEGCVTVGFALETSDLLDNARAKLDEKGFDLLVANPAGEEGAGFGAETNRVVLLFPDGERRALPLQSKDAVAEEVLRAVEEVLRGRTP